MDDARSVAVGGRSARGREVRAKPGAEGAGEHPAGTVQSCSGYKEASPPEKEANHNQGGRTVEGTAADEAGNGVGVRHYTPAAALVPW